MSASGIEKKDDGKTVWRRIVDALMRRRGRVSLTIYGQKGQTVLHLPPGMRFTPLSENELSQADQEQNRAKPI